MRNDGHDPVGRSMSLKVTDFGTDRKLVSNFLLVNTIIPILPH